MIGINVGGIEYRYTNDSDRVFIHEECDDYISSFINKKDEFDLVKVHTKMRIKHIHNTIDSGNIGSGKNIYQLHEDRKIWSIHIGDSGLNLRALVMLTSYKRKLCAFILFAFREKGSESKKRQLYSKGIEVARQRYAKLIEVIGRQ